MWLEFWKLFIPAGSISCLLSVTESLVYNIIVLNTLWFPDLSQ